MMPRIFNVNGVISDALELDEEFETVYAPELRPTTESQQDWCVVRFRVGMFRQIRPPFDYQRGYAQLGWRPITEAEARALWAVLQ